MTKKKLLDPSIPKIFDLVLKTRGWNKITAAHGQSLPSLCVMWFSHRVQREAGSDVLRNWPFLQTKDRANILGAPLLNDLWIVIPFLKVYHMITMQSTQSRHHRHGGICQRTSTHERLSLLNSFSGWTPTVRVHVNLSRSDVQPWRDNRAVCNCWRFTRPFCQGFTLWIARSIQSKERLVRVVSGGIRIPSGTCNLIKLEIAYPEMKLWRITWHVLCVLSKGQNVQTVVCPSMHRKFRKIANISLTCVQIGRKNTFLWGIKCTCSRNHAMWRHIVQ